MPRVEDIVVAMRHNQQNIRFRDLCRVCDFYFGKARQTGGSHRIYKTPWQGDPRINIQNDKGMSKTYQVRQVLKALDLLEKEDGS